MTTQPSRIMSAVMAGHAHGGHQDVGLPGEVREILRPGVADRDRGVGPLLLLHQQRRQRLADDVAPAADDDVLALGLWPAPDQQLDDAVGRARQGAGLAAQELADVDRDGSRPRPCPGR